MEKTIILLTLLFLFGSFALCQTNEISSGTMTDIEGNSYKTVKIGAQIWMAENLRVTRYNDSTEIPNIADSEDWSNATTGAYCIYNNDTALGNIYGKMYNYFAVADSRKLAPKGWHIPIKAEWETLINFLGGRNSANQKLREAGNTHWSERVRILGNNESGFTALPGGERWIPASRSFEAIKGQSTYWSASLDSDDITKAFAAHINDIVAAVIRFPKGCGSYIRCVKD